MLGVLGLHSRDEGDEWLREKEREWGEGRQKLERDRNVFYCVNILF